MLLSSQQKNIQSYTHEYFQKNTHNLRVVAITGSSHISYMMKILGDCLATQGVKVRMNLEKNKTPEQIMLQMLGINMDQKISFTDSIRLSSAMKRRLQDPCDVNVIIQRYDTYQIGDMQKLLTLIQPFVGVVTSIENEKGAFDNIQSVARERMMLANSAEWTYINHDEVSRQFAVLEQNPQFYTYGLQDGSDILMQVINTHLLNGSNCIYHAPELSPDLNVALPTGFDTSLRAAAAAIAIAKQLGVRDEIIVDVLKNSHPLSGKMNVLKGLNKTLIIDDSDAHSVGNSLEILRKLYTLPEETDRIFMFGDFDVEREVIDGEYSRLGAFCRPELLSWVVVVGEKAAKFFAPAAKRNGCQVRICRNSIEAAEFLRLVSKEKAIIGVSGGNQLYFEEAVKYLSLGTEHSKLTRQGPDWILKKQDYFGR